ncbi:MAG: 16S rRNA (cytosine(1402)-N(4))-methyltransferase RsmH [Deltaproteobacteria bacterium]|nr:16S rRNA (cytosine(1402)-N(4))-methyltransferase RsmH [Deltaproteobacteria bacterium]
MSPTAHRPVLVEAAVRLMAVKAEGVYVDATIGGGGYALALLEAGAARLIGLDWDEEALSRAAKRLASFGQRLTLIRAGFQELAEVLTRLDIEAVDGVVADLGLSSDQLAAGERGFSFQLDGPLDMRMDGRFTTTAADIIARSSPAQLKQIFSSLGQERRAGRVAKAIASERAKRPIQTTSHLAQVVSRAVGRSGGRIHPATRTFMALRLAVNQELENLDRLLESLPRLLRPGGKAVLVSYHSLEDGRVKKYFKTQAQACQCPPRRPCVCGHVPTFKILTPKPVRPEPAEVTANPRSRSARLRAAQRL